MASGSVKKNEYSNNKYVHRKRIPTREGCIAVDGGAMWHYGGGGTSATTISSKDDYSGV